MSDTPKHTPGPWVMRLSDNATPHIEHGDCLRDEIGRLENRVCVMPAEIMHDYNSLANARLIAAAPEMLEALKMAESCLDLDISDKVWNLPYTINEASRVAQAAIDKAEGRTL